MTDQPKAPSATTFLMFEGAGREAMTFYVDTLAAHLPDTAITRLDLRSADAPEVKDRPDRQGTVQHGEFTIAGTTFRVFDSPAPHAFTFTPAISIFIELPSVGDPADLDRVDQLADQLGQDGQVFMPPNDYGFSRRFAWVGDRWGVTWQLNCA